MLKYLFNEKFQSQLAERIASVIATKLDSVEDNLSKDLNRIRFDLKRIEDQMLKHQLKNSQDYGMLKYQVQNLEKKIEGERRKSVGEH
ncbi:MAG: hypothetical protein CME65_07330 [Halobacteriovoraceae bacterium]|nr:hypothetical protein [Halobacteriovoraceae bacterium]|tara:strand:- start:8083 stop:8346 length:264 start_codon:yes stop_codon:yes gene_type:complete